MGEDKIEHTLDNDIKSLLEENENLKRQLEYLRSGEYLNQLKYERNLLESIVQDYEIPKEDKEFIDMTHRNTELLEENQALKEKIRGKQSSIKALKYALKERTEERDNPYDKEHLYKSVIDKILDYVNSDEFEQLFESYANFNEVNCNINHFAKGNELGGDVDDE